MANPLTIPPPPPTERESAPPGAVPLDKRARRLRASIARVLDRHAPLLRRLAEYDAHKP